MSILDAPEDESLLWAQFVASRTEAARTQLIERYLPFARTIAARLYRMRADDSVSFNDYLQYARMGLIEAVDRYDPGREASFQTYSGYRIRGAVLSGLVQESEDAAQRRHRHMLARERIGSLQRAEGQEAGSELRELANLTVSLAIGLILEQADEPADASIGANPYAAAELAELRRLVREALTTLPERERQVIAGHYFSQQQFQSIAVEMGVSKGRVSQLHGQALARIRLLLMGTPELDQTA